VHPSKFGPYRVVRLIGQGGMGTVYEATDPATGRTVAIKTLPLHLANDDTIRRRFQSEIETLKKLSHPCIVHMREWGEEEGLPFFVMDYVPGLTLEALLRSGKRFTWRDTVSIAQEIVRALKSAHDLGVVHRDLKPANLIFPPAAGGGFHVKLTDFGIAKLFGETGLTRSGSVLGTPEYMAPEQAASQHVDRRGDLYNLGLVMFAMLAGKPPFQGAVAEVLESQRSREPPRITTLVRDVPKPLADLIERLLEKTPGRRPNNATIVARMLADVASAASKPSDQFAPSTAMPEVPDGLPTTIVTDVAGHTVQSDSRTAKATHSLSKGGPSTFTTREEDARAARIEREQKTRSNWLMSWLTTMMAAAIISSVLAGGCFIGKHVFFPGANFVHARIIQIVEKPDAHRLEYPPCEKIESFLARFPDDPRADGLRQIGREIGLDRLQKQMRRNVLKGKLGLRVTFDTVDKRRDSYLEALRLWIVEKDLEAAAKSLRGIIATPGNNEPTENPSPCDVTDNPDPAAWRELARRQLKLVDNELAEARGEALANTKKAEAMLRQAAELRKQVDDPTTHATERVIAMVQRHALLEQVEDTFADDPECTEQVKEARRLLDADR
jgi:serine/threonine-protein kinase